MSVLVTGGAGFVGSNVSRLLAEEGQAVVALGRNPPAGDSVLADVLDRVTFVRGDVTDLKGLRDVCERYRVAGIIHCAALVAADCNRRPIESVRVNVEGAVNVLEAARALNLRRVVCCSSSSVTGLHADLSRPMKEWDITLPLDGLYQVTKLAVEGICHTYRTSFGVDVIAVRPSRSYGPGYPFWNSPMPLPTLLKKAMEGQPIILERGGDSAFDYTYVRDTARGIALAYQADKPEHWLFNLSFGQLRSTYQVVEVLRQLFPSLRIDVGSGLSDDAFDIPGVHYRIPQKPPMDISLARTDLGFQPEYDIDCGIPAWAAWLDQREYI